LARRVFVEMGGLFFVCRLPAFFDCHPSPRPRASRINKINKKGTVFKKEIKKENVSKNNEKEIVKKLLTESFLLP